MYGAFDVLAQASRSEGLPNVLLEAAAAGCPIVATDAGGSGEIVVDGRTGLLVPTRDVDALAAALRRTIDDRELRRRLGSEARAHVAESFGMDRFVREYGDLYEELAAARGLRRGEGSDPAPERLRIRPVGGPAARGRRSPRSPGRQRRRRPRSVRTSAAVFQTYRLPSMRVTCPTPVMVCRPWGNGPAGSGRTTVASSSR